MNKNMIHTDMIEAMEDFFPDTCVIQECAETLGDYGETGKKSKVWTDKITDIKAAIGDSQFGTEQKQANKTYAISTHKILLNGEYNVIEKDRAVIDSVNYDILSVDKDSRLKTTRLVCEVVLW